MRVVTHEMMDDSLRGLQGMKWVDTNYDINVSFTYNADGTIISHVNNINVMPPLNQAVNDVSWRVKA